MLRKMEEIRRLSSAGENESYQNQDQQHFYSWSEIDYYATKVNGDSNSTIESQAPINTISESVEEPEEDSWFSPPKTRKR